MFRKVDVGKISVNMSATQRRAIDRYIAAYSLLPDAEISPGSYRFLDGENPEDVIDYRFDLPFTLIFRGTFHPDRPNLYPQTLKAVFFDKAKHDVLLPEGSYCLPRTDCHDGSKMDLWYLSATISARHKFKSTYYFDIIEMKRAFVGAGAYGVNFGILGTVKPRHLLLGQSFFSPGQGKRIIKLQARKNPITVDQLKSLKNEADVMDRLDYLRARDFQYYSDEDSVAGKMTMKYINGVTLYEILRDDLSGSSKLSVLDRLSLSIRLMRELERYFHREGSVHGDIKPDNIIVRHVRVAGIKYWILKHIDLGHTVVSGQGKAGVGTPIYMAPELFHARVTFQAEVYVAAMTISLIWRNATLDEERMKFMNEDIQKFIQHRTSQNNVVFKMFDGIEITDSMKASIQQILMSMTNFNAAHRPPLYMAINSFEDLRLNYYISLIPANEDQQLYRLAIETNYRKAIFLQEYLTDVTLRFPRLAITLGTFLTEIKKCINSLDGNQLAIRIFVDTLGVECIYRCQTKQDILYIVGEIVLSFSDAYADILAAFTNLSHVVSTLQNSSENGVYNIELLNGMSSYREYVKAYIERLDNFKFDLDSMIDMTKQMKRKVAKIADFCADLTSGTIEREMSSHTMKM